MYKIEFYIPESHLEQVKKAMFDAGAGKLENYDLCCWQTRGNAEKDTEWKVEMVCADDCIEQAINALKENHPYETPAYQYWEVKA